MKYIIAIDPGANGGLVLGNDKGEVLNVSKMPATPLDLLTLLGSYKQQAEENCACVVCYLEDVHSIPGDGANRMFNFGKNFVEIRMALEALGISTITMKPQVWIKTYQLGSSSQCKSKTEWKNKLKAKAQQIFPLQNVTLWSSDALLIYKYAQMIEK